MSEASDHIENTKLSPMGCLAKALLTIHLLSTHACKLSIEISFFRFSVTATGLQRPIIAFVIVAAIVDKSNLKNVH